jgi:hypothetical protein
VGDVFEYDMGGKGFQLPFKLLSCLWVAKERGDLAQRSIQIMSNGCIRNGTTF